MIARVRGVIRASTSAGSSSQSSRQLSAKTGRAPAWLIVLTEAM